MHFGVFLFEQKSRFLKEQMSWDTSGKQNKTPQNILLSLALHQSPFLINLSPSEGTAVGSWGRRV